MWILIVISAHFLNAINFIIDKLLLKNFIRSPIMYIFFIGMLGMVTLVALPWAWYLPTFTDFVVDMLAGVSLILALLFFFKALQIGETSRIAPLVGGSIPTVTFILSYLFLGERLSNRELLALLFLIVGTVVITFMREKTTKKKDLVKKGYTYAVIAASLFGISFILTKYAYINQEFLSAFIWIRIGSFLIAVLLLLRPKYRKSIKTAFKGVSKKVKALFIGNQAIGASAFLLLNWAISMASVSLINALQGVQYVFLIVAMGVLVKAYPQYFSEKITAGIIIQKAAAIVLIATGLFFLAF